MREILFRGKRIDNGEWVEGQTIVVIHQDDNDLIFMPQRGEDVKADPMDGNDRALTSIYGNYYQILPQTVGQYTGLTDKNGRRIFEGDIVGAKHPEQRKAVPCLVGFGEFEDVDSLDNYNYSGWFLKAYGKCLSILEPEKGGIELEVIGNIHDNPELLGGWRNERDN